MQSSTKPDKSKRSNKRRNDKLKKNTKAVRAELRAQREQKQKDTTKKVTKSIFDPVKRTHGKQQFVRPAVRAHSLRMPSWQLKQPHIQALL